MHLTSQEIKQEMGGRLVGNDLMRDSVTKAIAKLPHEIADPIINDAGFSLR